MKEKNLFEYDPNNDHIEENNFFISYFVSDFEVEVKRVNRDMLKDIKILYFGNNIPGSTEIEQDNNSFSSKRKYIESAYGFK